MPPQICTAAAKNGEPCPVGEEVGFYTVGAPKDEPRKVADPQEAHRDDDYPEKSGRVAFILTPISRAGRWFDTWNIKQLGDDGRWRSIPLLKACEMEGLISLGGQKLQVSAPDSKGKVEVTDPLTRQKVQVSDPCTYLVAPGWMVEYKPLLIDFGKARVCATDLGHAGHVGGEHRNCAFHYVVVDEKLSLGPVGPAHRCVGEEGWRTGPQEMWSTRELHRAHHAGEIYPISEN